MQIRVIDAILKSVSETSDLLRQGDSSGQVGSTNRFGDHQLKVLPLSLRIIDLLDKELKLISKAHACCITVCCPHSTCLLTAD